MRIISTDELRRLRRLENRDLDIQKIEKRYKKEIAKIYEEHEEAIDDLTDDNEREVHKLQRRVDQANTIRDRAVADATSEHADKLKALKSEHTKTVENMDSEIQTLQSDVTALETKVKKAGDLKIKELDIAEREAVLKSSKDLNDRKAKENEEYAKELRDLRKEIESDQYNKGFTDGVSDTLREAQEGINSGVDKAYKLAETALNKDTVVITTSTPPAQKQK